MFLVFHLKNNCYFLEYVRVYIYTDLGTFTNQNFLLLHFETEFDLHQKWICIKAIT